ncbi:hypothetical protein SBRCBS47491_002050 [Sporothrix bragantina]|uniref:Uncharacterized protein n=1 Tax=Sporothrix bragantina TaxID=671064 RepID=A0ABP0B3P1_9PEZI
MSVPLSRFWAKLAEILPEIASASYVAIDFEMTGIEPHNAPPLQRPTMEQLYDRAKQVTATFNVLQFGLTCISYEKDAAANTKENSEPQGKFQSRSYNFNVSPMFDTDSNGGAALARVLDRTLTLSYKTLMFLSKNRIRIEDAYDGGIPYLSRSEEARAVAGLFGSNKRSESELIDVDEMQEETKRFYADVIKNIQKWESDPPSQESYLNIKNPHDGPMSRFQRRLVYQILETEFESKYHAAVKEDYFMQITKRDDEVEEKTKGDAHRQRHKALLKQRGLRYIVEALVGGEFAEDVLQIYDLGDSLIEKPVKDKLRDSEAKLKTKTPILVGHNMFLDLCFLYATFFEPLPDTLDGFGHSIHKLFPRILDTKHILTHDDHEMMAPKILDDIFLELEEKKMPFAIEHKQSSTVNGRHPVNAHQAGHDSYKTSMVFLKEMWKHVESEGDIFPKHGGPDTRLVWESPSFQKFANKIRIGNAGLCDLSAAGSSSKDEVAVKEEPV